MTALAHLHSPAQPDTAQWDDVFANIAQDIYAQGYCIQPMALPADLAEDLWAHVQQTGHHKFDAAGIGRGQAFLKNEFVRTDEILWINGDTQVGQRWLNWTEALKQYLNRRLLLGLFSFESHFSHYAPGDYYKRHMDAFRGQANRVLTVVAYLNPGWDSADGGELVLYRDVSDLQGVKVTPLMGTLAVFLSEEFPHEVLPAKRDRYAIAGWYRVNASVANRIDPPR